jgi:hypothetical protein
MNPGWFGVVLWPVFWYTLWINKNQKCMANEQNAASVSPKLFPSLQGQPAAQPSLPKATPGTMSEESKNVFTELFGKDAAQKPGAMMNSVVEQQDKKGVSYFGNKPKEALTLKQFAKHTSNTGSTVLQASVLLFFLTVAFFFTQKGTRLSLLFPVNPVLRVETLQSQVDDLNAEVRVQNHLAAALLLDQYASVADEYLYNGAQANSIYTSQNKAEEFLLAAAEAKPQVLALLAQIQEQLSQDIPAEELPASILVTDNLIVELQAKAGQVDEQSLLQDIQDLQTAKALMQNATFHDMVNTLTVADVTDEQIQAVFDNFNSLNASSGSIISTIKSARPEWSIVMDELEAVTKTVDPLFGTEFTGNITISNVVFNSDGTVSLSGDTTTSDTTNFSLTSNLIDALEESDTFKNVEDRSFSKSDGESVYTGNFHISMELENNPASNE